jgi:hypothetical protein
MTTPVLYLEVDDEITSAAARIRAAAEDRLALVLPYGSRLATSRINFRLLAREASERGKTIEIVAADASARALATSAGLSVHPSVAALEGRATGQSPRGEGGGNGPGGNAPAGNGPGADAGSTALLDSGERRGRTARRSGNATSELAIPGGAIVIPRVGSDPVPVVGREQAPVRRGVVVAAGLAVVALAVAGAVLAFLLLPSASIAITPKTDDVGPLSVRIEARPDVTVPNQALLQIPSQRFPFDVVATRIFAATGSKVTEAKAGGNVTFTNNDTGSGKLIPGGSLVSTETGIRFRTLADVTLPPAGFDIFPPRFRPSTGSVAVQAVKAGPTGNVTAHAIVVIVGNDNPNLTRVTNEAATSGGLHEETDQISQGDVDAALDELNSTLESEFATMVEDGAGLPAGTTIFPETKELGAAVPTVDPKTLVGNDAPSFELGLKAHGTAVGVDASPVRALAEARLRERVQQGWSLDESSIQIQVGTPTVVGDIVTFPVDMRARQVRDVDTGALLESVRGLGVSAARAKLEDYGDVQVNVWPDWVTTIPTNRDRLTLTVASPAPAATPHPSEAPAPSATGGAGGSGSLPPASTTP